MGDTKVCGYYFEHYSFETVRTEIHTKNYSWITKILFAHCEEDHISTVKNRYSLRTTKRRKKKNLRTLFTMILTRCGKKERRIYIFFFLIVLRSFLLLKYKKKINVH